MLTPSLIHVAILAYSMVSSGHGVDFGLHVGTKTVANVDDKVVLRESPLSEKCGLGLEKVVRPDVEILELQASASHLRAALGGCRRLPERTWETPVLHTVAINTDETFSFRWDDNGGYYFGKKYFPCEVKEESEIFSFYVSFNH